MDTNKPDKKRGGCAAVVVVLALLPILYVASIGPAVRLATRGIISLEAINVIYAPISWAMGHSSALRAAMEWYCKWWMS